MQGIVHYTYGRVIRCGLLVKFFVDTMVLQTGEIKIGNNDYNETIKGFKKWAKVCTITAIITGVLGIITSLLTILSEFTDFEVKAPYLYGKIFVFIMLAIFLVLITLMIISYIKARKYKKLIENSNDDENQDIKKQNDSDN